MNSMLDIGPEEILPDTRAIIMQQGVPEYAVDSPQLLDVAEGARAELEALLNPAGVLFEVTVPEFADIYPGQGFNDRETPLEEIFPRAEQLALFAVTCGQAVCDKIRDLFFNADYPLGAALDAGASLAADQAAQIAQDRFAATLDDKSGVLRYSPGYCGWHVSGQKELFALLGNEPAGIMLTESCLMHPLKSVSGVIVAGLPEIHQFTNDYGFCTACAGKECRERIQSVLNLPEELI
jgi:hypothetical protein